MRNGSLRLRLFVAAVLSITLALFLTGFAVVRLFEAQLRERVVSSLDGDLLELAGALEIRRDGSVSAGRGLADPQYLEPYGGRYWRIVVTGGRGGAEKPLRSPSLWDYEIDPARPEGPQGEALIVVRRDIAIGGSSGPLTVSMMVAASEEEVQRPLSELYEQLILSLGMIATILATGAWLQVVVGLSPLDMLRSQLSAIRAGAARRLSGSFPDEVAPLVTELNNVLDLRDASLERARRRAGDLAHGLRTPLAVLSAIARDLRKEGREREAGEIEDQAHVMQRHVEHALARARLSSGKGHAASDLAAALQRVLAALLRLPEAERLAFEASVPPEAMVPIEQRDLTELLGNLLENAAKWAKSTVRVSYAAPLLVIEDDGPGVPEAELVHLGERGRRLDESKQGSGLGLSIVSEIADLYGLTISFGRSELGGLRAEIRV